MIVASTTRSHSCYAVPTLLTTAFVGWLLSAGTLWAQQKPDPLAAKAGEIKMTLRAGDIPAADEQQFDDFFNKYFFKQFVTPARPYSLDNLAKIRADLKAQYFGVAKAGSEARARLNKLAFKNMTDLLRGKYGQYDAAIKYNALLVIGDLNEKEGDAKTAAKPYPDSLAVLMLAAQSPKSRDYMKLAGLIGLERFAAASAIPQTKAAELTNSLLEMVNQQAPPANRSQEANDWMRRNAAQVLASLGSPGPDNNVVKAFEAVVADSDASPTMRCEFAQYFGQLKYPPAAKVDLSAVSNLLGHMTADICKQELDSAKLANRAPSRRIVMYSLYSAGVGIGASSAKSGLAAAAEGSPHQEFVDKVRTNVKSLYQWLDDPKFDEETLAIELGGRINELETVLVPRPTAKLVSEQKEKLADPTQRQDGARAAVDPATVGTKK